MNYFSKLYTRWQHFLHNEMLKQKVYSIVFESDTPKGRLFDIILISSIIVSVLMVILESMHLFSPHGLLGIAIIRVSSYSLLYHRIPGPYLLPEKSSKIHIQLLRAGRPAGHPAGLPELLPEGSTLPAGHPGLPAHPDIPHLQTILFHQ